MGETADCCVTNAVSTNAMKPASVTRSAQPSWAQTTRATFTAARSCLILAASGVVRRLGHGRRWNIWTSHITQVFALQAETLLRMPAPEPAYSTRSTQIARAPRQGSNR